MSTTRKNKPLKVGKPQRSGLVQLGMLEGGLTVLFLIGLFVVTHHAKPPLASAEQLQTARMQIIAQYEAVATTCSNDNTTPEIRTQTFNKYLRINRYGNRAVIRGCNDGDSLLAKVTSGSWQRTNVNISIDLRANPKWQRACLIDDIIKADTVIRPENQSIDAENLAECQYLASHDEVQPTNY
jgi:hypothetical protein